MKNWGCSSPIGKSDEWPRHADGTPVEPAFLEFLTGSQSEIDLTIQLLRAYSIPVFCEFPNNGEFAKTVLGFSGTGTALYVPETLLQDAQNILSADVAEEMETED